MKAIFTLILAMLSLSSFAQQFIAASYNIRQKNQHDIGNLWDDRKAALTQQIRYHEFDIFGVQEAFIEQINDMLEALPAYASVGVGRDDGMQKGEFSAIIYKKDRFELINSGTFWLSPTDITKPNKGWDAALPRICTWGIFKDLKKGKTFIFMNTHFDHKGVEARVESARLILAKAKELAKGLPLVLTGDFNFDEHHQAYNTLSKSGFVQDSYDLADLKYAPNSTFNNFGKRIEATGRIDHIFVSKPFTVQKFGILTDTYMGKFPSDHFPIAVTLNW